MNLTYSFPLIAIPESVFPLSSDSIFSFLYNREDLEEAYFSTDELIKICLDFFNVTLDMSYEGLLRLKMIYLNENSWHDVMDRETRANLQAKWSDYEFAYFVIEQAKNERGDYY